jgi:hypothetical protein
MREKVVGRSDWVIRHGGKHIATARIASEAAEAESK